MQQSQQILIHFYNLQIFYNIPLIQKLYAVAVNSFICCNVCCARHVGVCGIGGIAPLILNLSVSRNKVISLTF